MHYDKVAPAIAAIRAAERLSTSQGLELTGSVRFTISMEFPVAIIGDASASFQKQYPRVQMLVFRPFRS